MKRKDEPQQQKKQAAAPPAKAKKKSGSEKRERQAFIGFRATATEAAEIDAAADRAGLTRSAYVRAQSLAAPKMRATRRPSVAVDVLGQTLAQLGKCGSNINQIAHALNAGETVTKATIKKALDELRALAAQIVETLKT